MSEAQKFLFDPPIQLTVPGVYGTENKTYAISGIRQNDDGNYEIILDAGNWIEATNPTWLKLLDDLWLSYVLNFEPEEPEAPPTPTHQYEALF